jgi:hypothetical protein
MGNNLDLEFKKSFLGIFLSSPKCNLRNYQQLSIKLTRAMNQQQIRNKDLVKEKAQNFRVPRKKIP